MMNENLNKKVEAALQSLDGFVPASPKPFLLTRINARLQQNEGKGFWTDALSFINRPLVIAACLLLVLISNLLVFTNNNNEEATGTALIANSNRYELSITVAGIYDVENP